MQSLRLLRSCLRRCSARRPSRVARPGGGQPNDAARVRSAKPSCCARPGHGSGEPSQPVGLIRVVTLTAASFGQQPC